ncbi:hypothetical protein N7453_001028 [Penicillium expansum]|nr:hypothetical protein N7453_001028 [Penicillium expansum]
MSLAIRRDPAEIRTTVNVRSSDVLALNISLDEAEIDKLVESQTIRSRSGTSGSFDRSACPLDVPERGSFYRAASALVELEASEITQVASAIGCKRLVR